MGLGAAVEKKWKSSRVGQKLTEMQEKREQNAFDERVAQARQAEAAAEEEVERALVHNMNTYDSYLEAGNLVMRATSDLREAQNEHVRILREKDPVAARELEWEGTTSFSGTEECNEQCFNMVTRSARRVTITPDPARDDGSRPDRDKGERDMRSAGVGPRQNYSICSVSRGQGRAGDTPHDAGITSNLVSRSRSDHFWNKVQLAWDNCRDRTGRYPHRLFIDFFEGLRGVQQEAMETLMIQSIMQNFPDDCISRQKISRGQDGPVRCDFAMYGVTTLFAGSERNRGGFRHNFRPRDSRDREDADWFNDTFRSI